MAQTVKRLPTIRETWVQSLRREDLLEKEVATHSSILAWKIPWMKEPGGLQCMGSQRVGHDWVTSLTQVCVDFLDRLELFFLEFSFISQPYLIGESSCLWILANCCSNELASFGAICFYCIIKAVFHFGLGLGDLVFFFILNVMILSWISRKCQHLIIHLGKSIAGGDRVLFS